MPVSRLLIAGMSGAGKSTLLDELGRRGHRTVDTDYGGWTAGSGGPWHADQMAHLLRTHHHVVVAGTAENQADFYDRFDHVILLSAPLHVLLHRVRHRTNNPYGNSSREREAIRRHVAEVEPLLRHGADLELDGRRQVQELADAIEPLIGTEH